MFSTEWKISQIRDMFPCLSIERIRFLLWEANGNVEETVEMAFELLNDRPSMSGVAPLEQQPINEDYRMVITRVIRENCSNAKHSMAVKQKVIIVRLKLMVSVEGIPKEQIKYILRSILQNCNCSIRFFDELIPCIQAAYEEKCVEVHVGIELPCDKSSNQDALIEFTKSFTVESGYGLEMQPYMEIQNIDRILTDIRPDHTNVDILWIGIGNMPNMGLFFIRGEYVTKYNASSNKLIVNSVCETKINNAAGEFLFCSVMII